MTHRKSLRLLRRTVKVFMCLEEKFGKPVVFSPPAAEWEESGLSPVGDPQDSLSRRAWRRSSWGPAWKGRRSPWAREGSGWECSTQSESRCSWLWGARVHVPRSTSEVCKDTRPRVQSLEGSQSSLSVHHLWFHLMRQDRFIFPTSWIADVYDGEFYIFIT